jgi:hypothetical protein
MQQRHITIRIPRLDGYKTIAFNIGVQLFGWTNIAVLYAMGEPWLLDWFGAWLLVAIGTVGLGLRLVTDRPVLNPARQPDPVGENVPDSYYAGKGNTPHPYNFSENFYRNQHPPYAEKIRENFYANNGEGLRDQQYTERFRGVTQIPRCIPPSDGLTSSVLEPDPFEESAKVLEKLNAEAERVALDILPEADYREDPPSYALASSVTITADRPEHSMRSASHENPSSNVTKIKR